MKNTFKKIVASIMAVTSLTISATGLHSMAETNEVESENLGFGEGLIPESEDDLNAFAAQFEPDNQITPFATTSLPSSVDLSTSPCFPPIGNQGSIGSCTAWASTYYQYSYEVNKLNNVTSTANRVIYSPKWTYNNINSGVDKGSSYTDAYTLLKNQGAVTLNEFPYSSSGYDIQDLPTYNGAVEDMRNALNTRLSFYGTYTISGSGTVITSNKDSDLNQVKTALSNGKVLTFQTYNDFNYKKGTGNWSNTKLVYRCYDAPNSGSHAMTIVGYDDNVTCDINGNGTIEAGERGAFKVINSWGTTNSGANNAGVLWVMYDALNGKSANNLDESQFSYTRQRVFGTGTNNIFNYINVDHKTVMFVAEVGFTTERRNQIKIQLGKTTPSESVYTWNTVYHFGSNRDNEVFYDGTMVFDFGDLTESLIDFYKDFDLRVMLSDTYNDGYEATYKRIRITDNLGNEVTDFGTYGLNPDGSSYAPLWYSMLKKGDINLDRKVTQEDVDAILQYYADSMALKNPVISNLQFFLADMNNDGEINISDASLALSAVQ
ncbi:MAG: dockerin type I domain-containing protein [Ruminococcus flavefaciens]|nr:dockerin type I domain-containing protein [Ruminococcus flavefaciens]